MFDYISSMMQYFPLIMKGFGETLYMTFTSTALAYVIGMPLGVLLVLTAPNGLRPVRWFNSIANTIVNLLRSVPFLILMISITPLTKLIVGKTIGTTAAIVPLTISAAPFIARLVESSLNEVDRGIIEAMQSMGASNYQISIKAMLPEAMPSLITNAATATTTILGYSTMAGAIGGGGLGKIAVDYGLYRKETQIMLLALIVLVIVVQIIQALGNFISVRVDKRNN